MSALDDIPVRVEDAAQGPLRGNARPILHEIRHALDKLVSSGEETIIDLLSLPMAPGDEQELEQALGAGEVEVKLEAFGRSVIRETGYRGVWLVEHYNPEDEAIARFLEIAFVPAIVRSDSVEIRQALERLEAELSQEQGAAQETW